MPQYHLFAALHFLLAQFLFHSLDDILGVGYAVHGNKNLIARNHHLELVGFNLKLLITQSVCGFSLGAGRERGNVLIEEFIGAFLLLVLVHIECVTVDIDLRGAEEQPCDLICRAYPVSVRTFLCESVLKHISLKYCRRDFADLVLVKTRCYLRFNCAFMKRFE